MYCTQCGELNSDENKHCYKCGAALTQVASMPQAAPVFVQQRELRRTSGLAVASMVLGLVGIVLYFLAIFLGILAIIFGAIAISQTGKNPALGGRGMAIAGLVLGIVEIGIWIVLIIWFSSVYTYFY